MPLSPEDLAQLSGVTLSHYDRNAERFRERTWDHDVRQNIAALLRHIEGPAPWQILDFGCGPGRDLIEFKRLGHLPTGLEGSPALAAMAREASACPVMEQNFLMLDLPPAHFDGIYANASLFHVPTQELPRVLGQLHASLKPRGTLFCSNPRGHDEEGWQGERYGAWHELPTWQAHMTSAGFVELEHYYRPEGLPREAQNWLATVWRKPGA